MMSGQHEQERRRHGEVPLGAVPLLELRQAERQRPELLVLPQEQQRREQVVPVVEEAEQRDGGDRGLRQRHDHAGHDLALARAVHASGIGELLGDRHEELAQQEDRERVAQEARQDQRRQVADLAHAHPDDVERDDRHLEREASASRAPEERDLTTLPAHPRERVGDGYARHDDPERRQERDLRACSTCTGKNGIRWKTSAKLRHWNGRGHERGRDRLVCGHQRRHHDEEERRQEHRGDRDQAGVLTDRDSGSAVAARRGDRTRVDRRSGPESHASPTSSSSVPVTAGRSSSEPASLVVHPTPRPLHRSRACRSW